MHALSQDCNCNPLDCRCPSPRCSGCVVSTRKPNNRSCKCKHILQKHSPSPLGCSATCSGCVVSTPNHATGHATASISCMSIHPVLLVAGVPVQAAQAVWCSSPKQHTAPAACCKRCRPAAPLMWCAAVAMLSALPAQQMHMSLPRASR